MDDEGAASKRSGAQKLVMARRILLMNCKAAVRSYVASATDAAVTDRGVGGGGGGSTLNNKVTPAKAHLVECFEATMRHGLRRPVGGYFVLVAEVAGGHRSMQRSVEKALAASATVGPDTSPGTIWLGQAIERRRLGAYLDLLSTETALLNQYYSNQGILTNASDTATLLQSLEALQRVSRHRQRLSRSAIEAARAVQTDGYDSPAAGSRGSPAFSGNASSSDLDSSRGGDSNIFATTSGSDVFTNGNDGAISSPEPAESPEPVESADIHSRAVELILPALSTSFITSSDLERENAHFGVVEALIQALEESRNVDLVPRKRRNISTSSSNGNGSLGGTTFFQKSPARRSPSNRGRGHTRSQSEPIKWPPPLHEHTSASATNSAAAAAFTNYIEGSPKMRSRRASAAGGIGRPPNISESPLRMQHLPGENPAHIAEGAGEATPVPQLSRSLFGSGNDESTPVAEKGFAAVSGNGSGSGNEVGSPGRRRSASFAESDDSELDLRMLVAQAGRLQNEIAHQFPGMEIPIGGSGTGGSGGGGGGDFRENASGGGGGGGGSSGDQSTRTRSASRALSVTSASSDAISEFWRNPNARTNIRRLPSVDADHFTKLSDARSTAQGFLKSVLPSYSHRGSANGGGGMGSPGRAGEWLPDVRPVIADEVIFPGGKLPEPIINISALLGGGGGNGRTETLISDNLPMNPELEAGFVGSTATMLRGNDDWAPPRRQIIYHLHSNKLSKSKALEKQGYQCAGCGLIVELLSYVKRFRLCTYLGKYFCHSCHNNTTCVIPAKVLWKWDFKKYPVSNFARDILSGEDSIREDAVFDLRAVDGGSLYTKVAVLRKACELREQLNYYREYLKICKDGEVVLEMIDTPLHLASEPHLYSMEELEGLRIGIYVPRLESLLSTCAEHVKNCDRCRAKGHICEICNSKEVIFPMDVSTTTTCPQCKTVCHSKCWANKKTDCPKCVRIERYRLAKAARSSSAK